MVKPQGTLANWNQSILSSFALSPGCCWEPGGGAQGTLLPQHTTFALKLSLSLITFPPTTVVNDGIC